jgi:hypothetical protein
MVDDVQPPGRARVEGCPDCRGTGQNRRGAECYECEGAGALIWHACPRCGDGAWRYTNGVNDDQGMQCADLRCGYRWGPDDPGWLAQRIPASWAAR